MAGPAKVLFWQKRRTTTEAPATGTCRDCPAARRKFGVRGRMPHQNPHPERICPKRGYPEISVRKRVFERTPRNEDGLNGGVRPVTTLRRPAGSPTRHRPTSENGAKSAARQQSRNGKVLCIPPATASVRCTCSPERTVQKKRHLRLRPARGRAGPPCRPEPPDTKKAGLRKRRPDDTARKPHMTSNYFCSPRIRIATSRIVVSSSVTTPPSGPGSK